MKKVFHALIPCFAVLYAIFVVGFTWVSVVCLCSLLELPLLVKSVIGGAYIAFLSRVGAEIVMKMYRGLGHEG